MSEQEVCLAMRGTYSPEDNKLRLYASERLPRELYERVRGVGFIYAPQQKLFVAPMWTPEREDLLTELCGEIEDEDISLDERAKERAERFKEYSENRKEDAENAREQVNAISDLIPFGQPILVGHHSEARARKDAERIENGMRKAVKMWETAEYWERRAKGALRNAHYNKDVFVRAGRIKRLEADERREKKDKEQAELFLNAWTRTDKELTLERAKNLANYGHTGEVKLSDGSTDWSAWSALDKGKATVDEIKPQVVKQYQDTIDRAERWLIHIRNRLLYERALSGESGGIPTDQIKPEVGGAVYTRGKWLYIRKVNKISVSLNDSTNNTHDFSEHFFARKIPFVDIRKVMSKAEVDEHRANGELREFSGGQGFYLDTAEPAKELSPQAPISKPENSELENMREQLRNGVQVVSAPNLFPTPQELASRMVKLADLQTDNRVLEPSAGTGNILNEIVDTGARVDVFAVEINYNLVDMLKQKFGSVQVERADFLEYKPTQNFDRIIMNPPFDHGEDIKHILHAVELLKPNGLVVALCANGGRQQDKLKPLAELWEDLPQDTFESQGTKINAALLVIKKGA